MSYASEVLADSPAAYYRMDEASGLIQDSSGNANHATATAGAGSATYAEPGAIASDPSSKSILFNPNFRFEVPDHASLDLGDSFTIELWWRFDVNAREQWPISKGPGGYELRINSDDTFALVKAATSLTVTSTVAIPDDAAFHHIVATKDGSTVKLYLDGVDVTGTVDNSTYADTTDALFIGGYDAGSNQFLDGWLDEVAIYDAALSASRVAAHFAAAQSTPAVQPDFSRFPIPKLRRRR
jgi:hypothetical protein